MDVRASLEKEAQRRYLGVLEEKQRDTRQRADNSSRALADRWASNYAEAIATGNPDEIAAARDELQSVLQARESLPACLGPRTRASTSCSMRRTPGAGSSKAARKSNATAGKTA